MTTSGTTTTQMSRDTIIKSAMRKIGALAQGQSPSTEDFTNGTEALNNLVAEFQTLGMPLWSKKELNITLIASQKSYTIGISQAINTPFPLKVLQAWTALTSGTGSRQQLEERGIYDYNILPSDSGTSGSPSSYEYQPFINYGVLRIWPAPDTSSAALKTLTISYMAPFEDFISSADTPYFPKEWNNALVYGLAALLAPEWGMPIQDRGMLIKEAEQHKDVALATCFSGVAGTAGVTGHGPQ